MNKETPLVAVAIQFAPFPGSGGQGNHLTTFLVFRALIAGLKRAGLSVEHPRCATFFGEFNGSYYFFNFEECELALRSIKDTLDDLSLLSVANVGWRSPQTNGWRIFHSRRSGNAIHSISGDLILKGWQSLNDAKTDLARFLSENSTTPEQGA